MAQGPFSSYVPPGVYTETETARTLSGPPSGLQLPVFIGTGKETLSRDNFDLVRGSSSNVDQEIVEEDVSDRFVVDDTNPNNLQLGSVDGSASQFKVKHFPIVTGSGQGETTNQPQDVTVKVDGNLVSVQSVTGSDGLVTLEVPPSSGSTVLVTYFFNRTDTQTTDDLSSQVTGTNAILKGTQPENYSIDSASNSFNIVVNGTEHNLSLQTGSSLSARDVADDLNSRSIDSLTASVDTDNQGRKRLQLQSDGSLEILDGSANSVLGFTAGQSTDRNDVFYTRNSPIVDGSNGGIVSTDPDDITVKVNDSAVTVNTLDGQNGRIVLDQPPVVGSTVKVTYHYNTWQDTFDHLPDKNITQVDQVGDSPGRKDYTEGKDFIIKDGKIQWGSSVTASPEITTTGAEPFNSNNIDARLFDDKIYFEEVSRYDDPNLTPTRPSDRKFVLGNVPTKGDGRGTPTHDPADIKLYHGPDYLTAKNRGEITIKNVKPGDRRVITEKEVPTDDKVFATYHYNRLRDDTYTLTKKSNGKITVHSNDNSRNLYNVRFKSSSAADTIAWPSGNENEPDAIITDPANAVSEEVTVTFDTSNAKPAVFQNRQAEPYDIFQAASDNFRLKFNDPDNGINSEDTGSLSLDQGGFPVVVSSAHSAGTTYSVTSSEDTFEYQLDGTAYTADLNKAVGSPNIKDIAEVVWRSAPNETEVKGTATETFDFSSAVYYNIDIDGTNYTGSFSGTASDSASDVESNFESELNSSHGLSAGDITNPANDVDIIANSDGTVSIVAPETLTVNDANQSTDIEDVLGWKGGDVPNDDSINSYTLGNQLQNTKVMRTWEGTNQEYFLLRSRTTPSNPAETSEIEVLDANANSLLGFSAFDRELGAVNARNKGATLRSGVISSSDVNSLNSDTPTFKIFVDGTEDSTNAFGSVNNVTDVSNAIQNNISGVTTSVETDSNGNDHIRITSNTQTSDSSLEILDGSANDHLGFSEGESASQRKVKAHEIAAVLNSGSSGWSNNGPGTVDLLGQTSSGDFIRSNYVYTPSQSGVGEYLRFKSFGFGSDVDMTFSAPSNHSVYNDTGIGISDGDSATGVDGQDGFTVSSNNSNGSSGSGLVGQTYTDSTTGLRFTVLDPADADYANNDSFKLQVEEQQKVGGSLTNRAVPGIKMNVFNLSDVGDGDTALLETFRKGGGEPSVGDFYYISYSFEKQDFDTKLFTKFRDIEANYGRLDPSNPLTLASYLAVLNGASLIGAKQVQTKPNSDQASQTAYTDALSDLESPIVGDTKPDLIVPLTTDSEVQSATVKHCEIQSTARFQNERRCILGVASGTVPNDAAQLAENLNSKRAMVLYPDSAVMTVTDQLGQETSFIVNSTFIASALAGSIVSPGFDVATPYTRRQLVGFDRLNRSLDEVQKNRLATSGVTVIDDNDPFLEVRQGLTTDTSNRLTSTPSVIAIQDFVQQQSRNTLRQFIGLKFLQSRAQDVELAMTGLLNSLVENEIIVSFTGVSAEPDPDDPTQLNVEAFYSPVFPLLYLPITFTISSNPES